MRQAVVAGIFVAGGLFAAAQPPATPSAAQAQRVPAAREPAAPEPAGGKLYGVVRSGNIPLPGVTVTAQNALTGKRFQTTTGMNGSWSLAVPPDGLYVIRARFAAFAPGVQKAALSAASHDQTVNFELVLASRAVLPEGEPERRQGGAPSTRPLAANGVQSLSLMNALAADTETQAGISGSAGAALPSIAANSDFSGDSVAISGQSGTVSTQAGVDMDRMRDAMETMRAQGGGPGGNFGGPGGGLFGGGPGGFGGSRRGNFRGFNSSQPHGAIFWMGSNAALNAQPFSLHGQSQAQPASGSNRFGLTFMSAPYLPGLTKPSGKDTIFLTLSGQRSSTPQDKYATVPTSAERAGVISGVGAITPVQEALNLLQYFPEPTPALVNNAQNYHLLTTAQSNSTQAGARYMRSLGKNAALAGSRRRTRNQGLRQSISFNYNWSDSASDDVNIFPRLGGKSSSHSNSLIAGYTLGYHKLTSTFNVNWNRNASQTTNFFTNKTDIASSLGIGGINSVPLNYGLPNVILSDIQGLSEQQPSFSLMQTISASETLSWIHAKHNLRFGGDYRRVHRDFLGGSNSTGTFTFSGGFTGSALADFLLGEPQETTIDAAAGKSYLRGNVWDLYAQDDWRVLPCLTLNYGLRYEYFAPYTEKSGHLAMVDTNSAANANYPTLFTVTDEVQAGGAGTYNGKLPDSLVFPFRTAFAPRFGMALRLPWQMVVRAGYGINYTVGQYGTFASTMARQPMVNQPSFVNEQTNVAASVGELTLASGFGAPDTVGSYALDPHYRLPYVQAWNLDVQKTLPWGVMLNVGYNGARGSNLDITSAPRPASTSHIFNYEQAAAFSRFNAGSLRVNKRLSGGLALGANYQYSHSIDNAGSVGGTSTVVAQNWQDLKTEEGNSSFDRRHRVSGTYLYELPFGKDKSWLTSGAGARILEGFSVSGSFTFATGTPLTPSYQAAVEDVTRGTAGTLRPDRVQGVSLTAGGGSLKKWFNTAAFTKPAGSYGTASRNSIPGPGTVQNDMSLAKTMQLGGTRGLELRATASNVFNTVQYAGVDTNKASTTFGQVTSAASMREFQFTARFRY
jgi:trimeric autotransporter adhesin